MTEEAPEVRQNRIINDLLSNLNRLEQQYYDHLTLMDANSQNIGILKEKLSTLIEIVNQRRANYVLLSKRLAERHNTLLKQLASYPDAVSGLVMTKIHSKELERQSAENMRHLESIITSDTLNKTLELIKNAREIQKD